MDAVNHGCKDQSSHSVSCRQVRGRRHPKAGREISGILSLHATKILKHTVFWPSLLTRSVFSCFWCYDPVFQKTSLNFHPIFQNLGVTILRKYITEVFLLYTLNIHTFTRMPHFGGKTIFVHVLHCLFNLHTFECWTAFSKSSPFLIQ